MNSRCQASVNSAGVFTVALNFSCLAIAAAAANFLSSDRLSPERVQVGEGEAEASCWVCEDEDSAQARPTRYPSESESYTYFTIRYNISQQYNKRYCSNVRSIDRACF